MPTALVHIVRVQSYQLDSFGHVNNSVYLNYLEAARQQFLRQVGLSFHDFARWGAFPVVTKATLEFKSFLRADDEVALHGAVLDARRAKFAIEYRAVRAADDTLVLLARTEHVFIGSAGRPVGIPEPFRVAFGFE